jgi:basic membrane lipoprotein Med (substrate-binding protein (PBP1-ABC) superfamily)
VNTLAAGCDVVVAVGGAQVEAAGSAAGSYPAVRFVLVGSGTAGGNVAVVRAASASGVAADVDALLSDAIAGRFVGRVLS